MMSSTVMLLNGVRRFQSRRDDGMGSMFRRVRAAVLQECVGEAPAGSSVSILCARAPAGASALGAPARGARGARGARALHFPIVQNPRSPPRSTPTMTTPPVERASVGPARGDAAESTWGSACTWRDVDPVGSCGLRRPTSGALHALHALHAFGGPKGPGPAVRKKNSRSGSYVICHY